MARIQFAAEVEEILGKLAGSVFQDSYGGFQIRGWSKPKNPQTQLSQLRRGDFRFLSAGWRYLTPTEQNTWLIAAGTNPQALRLFIGNNINLILIGEDFISSYTSETVPDAMPLAPVVITPDTFLVAVSTDLNIVPANTKLLLFATTDKLAGRVFNNPSEYQPIAFFDEGFDFTEPVDVIAFWRSKYGALRSNRYLCIKSVLINKTAGQRGEESLACLNSTDMIYKVFTCLLTQSGTDAPEVIVLENTTGRTFTPAYQSTGYYTLTADGTLDEDNTIVFIGNGNLPFTPTPESITVAARLDDTTVLIHTFSPDFVDTDNTLKHTSFELRLYP